jgi:hypothetical protein
VLLWIKLLDMHCLCVERGDEGIGHKNILKNICIIETASKASSSLKNSFRANACIIHYFISMKQ